MCHSSVPVVGEESPLDLVTLNPVGTALFARFPRLTSLPIYLRYLRYGNIERTCSLTSSFTAANPRSLRFVEGLIHSLMCRVPDCVRMTLPVPVILNRRAAALFVFILGMVVFQVCSLTGRRNYVLKRRSLGRDWREYHYNGSAFDLRVFV
jgi:hypothetical protein